MGYEISRKQPGVIRLAVHEPNHNYPQFSRSITSPSTASTLVRYFLRPDALRSLQYIDFYERYTHHKIDQSHLNNGEYVEKRQSGVPQMRIVPRARTDTNAPVARIQTVRPGMGEVFYIRALLCHRAATSWTDLKTVDGIIHGSYADAAKALGLFRDNNEAILAMEDAIICLRSPTQLRFLFSQLILEGGPATVLWNQFHTHITEDYLTFRGLPQTAADDKALCVIADHLDEHSRSLKDFGLPQPHMVSVAVEDELSYFAGRQFALLTLSTTMYSQMTDEQKQIFNYLLDGVTHPSHLPKKCIFIEGMAGRGKSFLLHGLCHRLRSEKKIVIIGGSTALSIRTYERGRTLHNLFHISIKEVRN